MRDAESLPFHELTGLEAAVVGSTNRTLLGMSGRVVFETRNTLGLLAEGGRLLSVPKDVAYFRFRLENGSVKTIDGRLLRFRAEERTARWLRRSRRRTWD